MGGGNSDFFALGNGGLCLLEGNAMTLASEIAALTGNEDAATLRAIDARVAVLLGGGTLSEIAGVYLRGDRSDRAPEFTTDIRATLTEIRRRGWTSRTVCGNNYCNVWFAYPVSDKPLDVPTVERTDDNLTLAALEAMVRAVEGVQTNVS